jgi:hypothetical protein
MDAQESTDVQDVQAHGEGMDTRSRAMQEQLPNAKEPQRPQKTDSGFIKAPYGTRLCGLRHVPRLWHAQRGASSLLTA